MMSGDEVPNRSSSNEQQDPSKGASKGSEREGERGQHGEEEPGFRDDIILLNKVWFTGRLGQDPRFRIVKGEYSLCTFSLAVSRASSNSYVRDLKDLLPPETIAKDTDWFNCELWGYKAETAARLLKKGMRVGIEGSIGENRYRTRQGEMRQTVVVKVNSFELLESKRERQEYLAYGSEKDSSTGYESLLPRRKPKDNFSRSSWDENRPWNERRTGNYTQGDDHGNLEQNGSTPLNDIPF